MESNIYHIDQKRYKRKGIYANKKIFIFLFVVIILLIFSGFFLVSDRQKVVLARYEEVVDGFLTKALIIRDEMVQFSPASGYVYLTKAEGERVGYGNKVLELKNRNNIIDIHNYFPGIISYATDGLENYFQPEFINTINTKDLNRFVRNYKQLVNGDYLSKGQPAFRIINNNYLCLVIEADAVEIKRYKINEVVFIKDMNLDIELIEGKIIKIINNGNRGFLIIKLERFIKEWLNLRWVKVKFIKNIYRGIVIPRSAIFTQPEGEGVLLYYPDGSFKFKDVRIIAGNEDRVVVEGIEIGDNIIANPASVDYGRGG